MGLLMMIETQTSSKIVRAPRISGWASTRLCVSSPLRRMLFRGNQDPVYYLGIRLRQQLITPGVQQFVARTRTVADPFDVLYHANPCC
jgi:hypothetical protein